MTGQMTDKSQRKKKVWSNVRPNASCRTRLLGKPPRQYLLLHLLFSLVVKAKTRQNRPASPLHPLLVEFLPRHHSVAFLRPLPWVSDFFWTELFLLKRWGLWCPKFVASVWYSILRRTVPLVSVGALLRINCYCFQKPQRVNSDGKHEKERTTAVNDTDSV